MRLSAKRGKWGRGSLNMTGQARRAEVAVRPGMFLGARVNSPRPRIHEEGGLRAISARIAPRDIAPYQTGAYCRRRSLLFRIVRISLSVFVLSEATARFLICGGTPLPYCL